MLNSYTYISLYFRFIFYSYYFYPVLKLSDDGRILQDASFESSCLLISMIMLCVWSLWAAVCTDPDPYVVLFVITCLLILSYVLLKSRNFDDFSKLIGIDIYKLNKAFKESLEYHYHDFPNDIISVLQSETLNKSISIRPPSPSKSFLSIVEDEEEGEGGFECTITAFESLKTILSFRDKAFTDFVSRNKFTYPDTDMEECNHIVDSFFYLNNLINCIDRLFGFYRLKALKDATREKKLRQAEIVNFIRLNVPDMSDISISRLEKIRDIDMVNIIMKFKTYKQNMREKEIEEVKRIKQDIEDQMAKRNEERRKILLTNAIVSKKKKSEKFDLINSKAKLKFKNIARLQLRINRSLEALEIASNNMKIATSEDKSKEADAQAKAALEELEKAKLELSILNNNNNDHNNQDKDKEDGNDQNMNGGNSLSSDKSKSVKSKPDSIVTTLGVVVDMSLDEYISKLPIVKGKYEDGEFSCGAKAKRFSQCYPDFETVLDKSVLPLNPSPDDIIQGSLGDCYFLSAIATIAEKSYLLDSLFPFVDMNRCIFAVRLYHNGGYCILLLDDYFPHNGSSFLYARGGEKQARSLWVMLLEKAYAKLHG